nr:MAG TPA: hypothetical protein [Caudoviricetes sp.]
MSGVENKVYINYIHEASRVGLMRIRPQMPAS